MNAGVYTITNKVDGKLYIGSAQNFRGRWNEHRRNLVANRHCNSVLQNAWNKHGAQAFVFDKLIVCDKELLLVWEQFAIDSRISSIGQTSLYNIALVAGAPQTGRKQSPETIAKKVAATKDRKCTPEQIERYKAAQQNRLPITDAARKKMSDAKKGRTPSDETRRKQSKNMLGRKMSDQHYQNSCLANRRTAKKRIGQKQSEETIQKRVAKNTGKKRTPQQVQNLINGRAAGKAEREASGKPHGNEGRVFSDSHKQALKDAWVVRKNKHND